MQGAVADAGIAITQMMLLSEHRQLRDARRVAEAVQLQQQHRGQPVLSEADQHAADQQAAHDAETYLLRQRVITLLQTAHVHIAKAEARHTEVDAYQALAAAAPDPPAELVEEVGPITIEMLPVGVFTPTIADLADTQLRPASETSTPESTLGQFRAEGAGVVFIGRAGPRPIPQASQIGDEPHALSQMWRAKQQGQEEGATDDAVAQPPQETPSQSPLAAAQATFAGQACRVFGNRLGGIAAVVCDPHVQQVRFLRTVADHNLWWGDPRGIWHRRRCDGRNNCDCGARPPDDRM